MSSKVRSSARWAVTSWYSTSIIDNRSPSSETSAPVDVLIVRMLAPEALNGACFVCVQLEKVLRAGHCQHRLDALLHAGQLERRSGGGCLAVQIHKASDRRAVHVGDRRQVDEHLPLSGRDEAEDRAGE